MHNVDEVFSKNLTFRHQSESTTRVRRYSFEGQVVRDCWDPGQPLALYAHSAATSQRWDTQLQQHIFVNISQQSTIDVITSFFEAVVPGRTNYAECKPNRN